MTLDQIWQLSYDSKTIDILRNSKYAIPLIQSVHLVGITLLLGTTVAFSFRMLGIGLREIPRSVLAAQLWKWSVIGLVLTMVSGFLVFLPDPARYAANSAFLFKMFLLVVAIVFQFSMMRKAIQSEPDEGRRSNVTIACLALVLWFCVGWAGRAIAFVG
jgi:hypothetical protein